MTRRRLCTRYVLLALLVGYGCSDDSTSPPPPDDTGSTPFAHRWSRGFGDGEDQLGVLVTADGSGNVIAAGDFHGTVNFGGGDLTSADTEGDIFVAKFNSAGSHLWSKRFGDGSWPQFAFAASTDGAGNVVLTGYFYGDVDFGGGVLTASGPDIYVAKLDAAGNHLWSKKFGGVDFDMGHGVAVDGSGNVIVVGSFRGSIDFGGGVLTSAGGNVADDIFVAKFDATGNHVWSKNFGDASAQSAYGVAVDGSGNVIVTGPFDSSVDFGGGVLTSAGQGDIYVAKFDATGNHVWSKRFGDTNNQAGYAVGVDGSGNVMVAGFFYSSVDFGGGVLTSAGNRDAYIAKFGPSGNHLWSKRFGSAFSDDIYGATVDGPGNVVVTGIFHDSVDFGGGALTSAGDADIFVAKFNASGNHILSKRFGDAGTQWGNSVAVDASGNTIMGGAFAGEVDFGGGVRTSAGGYDIFLATFAR